jgi:hypothetical protein
LTQYVVTRRGYGPVRPIQRFMTVERVADFMLSRGIGYWYEDSQFGVPPRHPGLGEWTVLAQEANRVTADTPYRSLREHEHRALLRALRQDDERGSAVDRT